jgi:hypothetical protein
MKIYLKVMKIKNNQLENEIIEINLLDIKNKNIVSKIY